MPRHFLRLSALVLAVVVAFSVLVTPRAHAAGTWSPLASMSGTRGSHSATLLQNGKVLVAGGYSTSTSTYLSSAELYDPLTNTWSAAPNMSTIRVGHSATLLPNGKVLMAGGNDGVSGLSSAEVYDPATNAWSAVASLPTVRGGHTATLLQNDKVLLVGGGDGVGYPAAALLYDAAANTWSSGGTIAQPRGGHCAALLQNSKVLMIGGNGPAGAVYNNVELYDPATNSWSNAASLATARNQHVATALPNGKVLVAGGSTSAYQSGTIASCELYDPIGNLWTPAASLSGGRWVASLTLLPSGKALICGGQDAGSHIGVAELYDPVGNTWTATGSLNTGRMSFTTTMMPDGTVFAIGGNAGSNGNTTISSTEVFSYAAGSWSATGSMGTPRASPGVVLLPNGKILAAGGTSAPSTLTATAELYDPAAGTWAGTGNMSSFHGEGQLVLLPNGKVLVASGGNGPGNIVTCELFDPSAGTWSATGNMNTARANFPATLLPSGKVLVSGGNTGGNSAEVYDPQAGTWALTGSMTVARASHSMTLLPNGKVLVAGGYTTGELSSAEIFDPATGAWTATGSMATARRGHFAVLLPNGKVLVAGGASPAPTATCELYDPSAGAWSAAGNLSVARYLPYGELLADGKVLVAGGNDPVLASAEIYDPRTNSWTATGSLNAGREAGDIGNLVTLPNGKIMAVGGSGGNNIFLNSCELFDTGLGFTVATQPVVDTATTPLNLGQQLAANGYRFRGVSEAYGGSPTCLGSETNYPLLQLRSLVNEQMAFLPSDANNVWSDTLVTSTPVNGFPPGYALATVFTNGIPSVSKIILIQNSTSITSLLTASGMVDTAFSYSITASNSPTSFNATGLPGGLTVNTSTGVISGTPTTAGSGSVTLSATNTTGTGNATLNLTINKATPTVNWSNPADITYPAALSATQLNATASVPGTFSYTPASGTVLNAGAGQTLSVSFTPTDGGNYNTQNASVTINVFKGTPIVTWSNPADITFGFALGATQLNATANTVGSFAYTPASGTVLNAGASQALSVQFTPTDTANWNTPAAVNVSINVLKATPSVTWNNPADIIFGAALSGTELNATASVAGSYAYTPAAGTVLNAGAGQALSVQFTPTNSANYNAPAAASVSINVAKALPSITWSDPAGIIHPVPLSATQLNATASVPGSVAYSPALNAVLNAGNQPLAVTFTPTDAANYTSANKSVTINVAKGTPVVTWSNPADIFNPTPLSATQLSASANTVGTFAYTPVPGAVLSVGASQTLTVQFTPNDTSNFNTPGPNTVTINVINGAPSVTSALSGTAVQGQAFSYTVAATAAGSQVFLSASNLPAGLVLSGDTISGTPAVSGTFVVTLTASNTSGSDTKTLTLVVGSTTDKDNDGFSDELEVALGSNPDSAVSSPITGNGPAPVPEPLAISSFLIKLAFGAGGSDAIGISGFFPETGGSSGSVSGRKFTLNIGGNVHEFALDAKGMSPKANQTVKVKSKNDAIYFSAKFNKGTYAPKLVDEGLVDNVTNKIKTIKIQVLYADKLIEKSQFVQFTSKAGKGSSKGLGTERSGSSIGGR